LTIKMVIPTMRPESIIHTLDDIREQSIVPDKVVIVDNTKDEIHIPFYNELAIYIHREKGNSGVNKAWNMILGEKQNYDYIGFCGDHRLGPFLFEKCIRALQNENVGIVCPQMVDEFPPTYIGNYNFSGIRSGKGNCSFVLMRKEVAEKIPKIPDELKIFFGDNWISYWITKQGLLWVRLLNGYIRRDTIGVSAQKGYWRNLCRAERHHYDKIMREL